MLFGVSGFLLQMFTVLLKEIFPQITVAVVDILYKKASNRKFLNVCKL
ncbi:hypothetical protein SORDD21_00693 [Streptococcus oralis]|uniref:Uncharacterized protein n=1 Tax=Streptococcus oralis TaxID=1303 RepID=A0A139PMW9_STROR|nr:hypothetical protein SORDD21_00693 [Streptococcus oralis]